jgi:hypothetical protein
MKFGVIRFTINMRHIYKIILIAVVILGTSGGLWFYLNGYLTKSKASTTGASFRFSETSRQVKVGDTVMIGLTMAAPTGVSGVDVVFNITGTTLDFLAAESAVNMPVGFDELIPTTQTAAQTTATSTGTRLLKRLMYVSKRPSTQLPKSIVIPLYFKVINNGQANSESTVSVDLTQSQVIGGTGYLFTLEAEQNPLAFKAIVQDPRAAPVTNLTCSSSCGRNIALQWGDSSNEDKYTILKDGKTLTTSAKNSTSYMYSWCGDFKIHNFAVISSNIFGSVSANSPTVECACMICPTKAPPTPTPIAPTNSSDLIIRLNFPDVAQSVSSISQVKIMVTGNNGERICPDDTNCAQVVTLNRMGSSTYFSSPQLQFNIKETKPYAIIVKQSHTVQRIYKNVFLKWKQVLNCLGSAQASGCGQLISNDINTRPLFSGDLDGLDKTTPGFNIIDISDLTRVGDIADSQKTLQAKSEEGDMNFDGSTDVKDYGIVAKNLNKKGD